MDIEPPRNEWEYERLAEREFAKHGGPISIMYLDVTGNVAYVSFNEHDFDNTPWCSEVIKSDGNFSYTNFYSQREAENHAERQMNGLFFSKPRNTGIYAESRDSQYIEKFTFAVRRLDNQHLSNLLDLMGSEWLTSIIVGEISRDRIVKIVADQVEKFPDFQPL